MLMLRKSYGLLPMLQSRAEQHKSLIRGFNQNLPKLRVRPATIRHNPSRQEETLPIKLLTLLLITHPKQANKEKKHENKYIAIYFIASYAFTLTLTLTEGGGH